MAPPLLSDELSNPLLQVVGNLFRWSGEVREVFRFSTPLVTVTPAKNPCFYLKNTDSNRWEFQSRYGLRELKLGQCTGLWRSDLSLPEPLETIFQVQLRGQIVAEVATQVQANAIARRLQQALRNPYFDPHSLYPAIVGGVPAVKAGEEVLFWLEPELALWLDRNPELMAIGWTNNLRAAMNIPSLPLAEAQRQMHHLVPTKQQIHGLASWYGPYFHGRLTATGEIFDQHALTAAHPTLPFNTYLKVTNLLSGKTVIVRINDRGPYFEDRSLDLSYEAARCLDSEATGVVPYEAVIMEPAELAPFKAGLNPEQLDTAQLFADRP
ncbi:MAG: hypothetical protein Kow00121_29440 [Elainellaceae cyanobacterium]